MFSRMYILLLFSLFFLWNPLPKIPPKTISNSLPKPRKKPTKPTSNYPPKWPPQPISTTLRNHPKWPTKPIKLTLKNSSSKLLLDHLTTPNSIGHGRHNHRKTSSHEKVQEEQLPPKPIPILSHSFCAWSVCIKWVGISMFLHEDVHLCVPPKDGGLCYRSQVLVCGM